VKWLITGNLPGTQIHKRMRKSLRFLVVTLLLSPLIGYTQLQIKGVLHDEKGSSLSFATVLLLSSSDSTLVQGQVSDASGFFSITVNEEGTYFIAASAIGYADTSTPLIKISKSTSPYEVGKLVMPEKVQELNEVVVRAERPMFEQKIDRTVINVQSSITRAGGTALDVLQRSPGVTVDKMNSAVSLSGKQGVRIMINGKISRIPMQAVVQMLDGINAENIDRIELITTPPSKYEAEGDAGIINIVMKQMDDIGSNGSLSVFTGYGRRGKYGGTLNINKRSRKLNLYADLSTRNDYTQQYFNSDWSTAINGEIHNTLSNNNRMAYTGVVNGSVGVDWNIGKKTTVGGLFNFFDRRWDMDALADITRFTNQNLSGTIEMNTIEENDWLQLLGNINLTHVFNDRYSISIDADKIGYNSGNPTTYYQDFYDSQGSPAGQGQLRSIKDTGIDIWTSSFDFTGKVNDNFTFELGAKGTFTALDNDIVVDNLENNTWIPDDELTVYATMIENIGAGYASATIKASDKLDIQAGIRYEHTITNIDTQDEQNVVDRNFGKWFPSVFINNKINDNNSWVLSYSRRIARPSFSQLAPFVIFNDPNNLFGGNIALLPSFTNAFKAEYRHKSILVSFQYSHDENAITQFQPKINDDNKQVSTSQNLDYQDNFSIVLSFPIHFTEWWEMQLNGIGRINTLKASYLDNPVALSIRSFSFNGTQKIKISKSVTAELSGFYQSPQLFGVMEMGAVGAVDIGIEKKFTNSTLRISFSDIFETNKWEFHTEIPEEDLNTDLRIDMETTVVTVTYSLNFGNNQLKAKRSGKTSSKEEQDRLQ